MTATPATICVECMHPRPDRHKTRCTVGIGQLFATIDEHADLLSIERDRLNPMGEGNTPGFVSSPPIDLTARAHQDPASSPYRYGPDDVDRPTLSVDRTLGYWAGKGWAVGGDYRDLPWVVHQPWLGDMVADLRTLAAQLLAATGEPLPKPIGKCTRVLGIVQREILVCDEPLYMPAGTEPRGRDESIRDLPEIRCPHPQCGERYTGADLIRLKLADEHDRRRTRSGLMSTTEGVHQRFSDDVSHLTHNARVRERLEREQQQERERGQVHA